ncbi:MAG TPA: carbohydrate kinase family protein [Bauldia sp.]|nr:carbohydrate kinase family protein [Bauldia sp.]
MTREGILTGGTWCVDRNVLLDRWPEENGRADIVSAEQGGGGSGCNLAIAMKKLAPDMPVATIALVGDDADGRFLIEEADKNGIDRRRMRTTAQSATDYTFAFASAATGRRTHISWFGTSHLLTPDDFDFDGDSHRIFHLGLPGIHRLMDGPWQGDANGWVTTLKQAKAAGLVTNLELASIAPERLAALVRPCLPHLDLLVVNDAEIGGIAGIETVRNGTTDTEACVMAARKALEMGAMEHVAVHFPTGAVVACRDGSVLAKPSVAVPPAELKGANGAGDAFAAGFLYGFHEAWPLDRALALAHATAAASLRQISTTASIGSWQDCLALAERWGWRPSLA